MVYSEEVDGALCIACAIFSAHLSRGKFVVQLFRAWHKKSEKTKKHERCLYHQSAREQADRLVQTFECPQSSVVL